MRGAVDGLVLREARTGESDKLLTVLTATEGQILVTAKGVCSARSKYASICRPLVYINFEYYERNGRRWFAGGSLNEGFRHLSADLTRLTLGNYVLQVAEAITGEGAEAEEVLRMTLNALYALDRDLKPPRQIKAAYEVFAAVTSGFTPELGRCADCGHAPGDPCALDVMNGRAVCRDCLRKRSVKWELSEEELGTRRILVPLDGAALAAMRYVAEAPIARSLAFGFTEESSAKLFSDAAEIYLLNHLERNFDTLDFYKRVKDMEGL